MVKEGDTDAKNRVATAKAPARRAGTHGNTKVRPSVRTGAAGVRSSRVSKVRTADKPVRDTKPAGTATRRKAQTASPEADFWKLEPGTATLDLEEKLIIAGFVSLFVLVGVIIGGVLF